MVEPPEFTPLLPKSSGWDDLASRLAMRRAVAADIPTLERWEIADHVVAISGDDEPWDWAVEINVPWQEVWIAEVEGRAIGVVVLLDAHTEPTGYWGDVCPGTYAIDIWIGEPDALHRGYGTLMMRHALDRAFIKHDAHEILIDPLETNTDAIGFYKHLGFKEVGPRRFGTDDCLVLTMLSPPPSHTFPPDSGGNAQTGPDSGGSEADPPESGGNG